MNTKSFKLSNSKIQKMDKEAFDINGTSKVELLNNKIEQLSARTFKNLCSNELIELNDITINKYEENSLELCNNSKKYSIENIKIEKVCQCNMYKIISDIHEHKNHEQNHDKRVLVDQSYDVSILHEISCFEKNLEEYVKWHTFDLYRCSEEHNNIIPKGTITET